MTTVVFPLYSSYIYISPLSLYLSLFLSLHVSIYQSICLPLTIDLSTSPPSLFVLSWLPLSSYFSNNPSIYILSFSLTLSLFPSLTLTRKTQTSSHDIITIANKTLSGNNAHNISAGEGAHDCTALGIQRCRLITCV